MMSEQETVPVKFFLRLPAGLLARIRSLAAQERRSTTQQMIALLDAALRAQSDHAA